MKKFFLLSFMALAFSAAKADVCIPGDADFSPTDCSDVGGTIGTASGVGGGPGTPGGGPAGVPIDGGLSILLASGGAMAARRAWQARKAAKQQA